MHKVTAPVEFSVAGVAGLVVRQSDDTLFAQCPTKIAQITDAGSLYEILF